MHVYGTCLLIVMSGVVFFGVKIVNKSSYPIFVVVFDNHVPSWRKTNDAIDIPNLRTSKAYDTTGPSTSRQLAVDIIGQYYIGHDNCNTILLHYLLTVFLHN